MEVTAIEGAASSILLRAVSQEDAVAVAELSGQLGYEVSVAETRGRIEFLLAHTESQMAFVACLNEQVVGWIEASVVHHLQSPPHALIGGLVVKDGVRSLGVGRRLCAEVENWSRSRGIVVVRVTSRSTRERAHRFYLRDGYRQTKISAVFEKLLS
jgi:GNAT superfamily N-acetyltransferase